jgi:PAS domain S-box-containing protein
MSANAENLPAAETEVLYQQYEQLVMNSPMGMFFYELRDDGALIFLRANPAADRLLGVDTAQFVGKTIEDAFPALAETQIPQRYREAAEHGVPWSTEHVDYHDDQITGAFEVHAFQTSPRKMACLFLEITDRKRNEVALQESESKFRILAETTSDWIWAIDRDGVYTYANPQVRRILGYEPDEVLGKTPFDFMPPDEAARLRRLLAPLLQNGLPLSQLQNRNLTKDGREVLLETSALPFRDETGALAGYRGIDRDVTERHHQEQQLRQSQKMQAIGELAGGIAHDFNNQLTGIAGFADLLREDVGHQPHLAAYADGILLSVKRASDLTSQLLAFARKGKYLSVKVDLNELLTEVATLLSHAVDKRIEIHRDLTAPQAVVRGDPSLLQNALLNLGLNARDAMPEGGVLALATDRRELDHTACQRLGVVGPAGAYVCVSVSDTGIGMNEETKRRIFEPFFTTKQQGKGTGMGMAAVYGTVKTHGGSIRIESQPGAGARVEVFLPLCLDELPGAGSPPEPPARASVPPACHVLLVDDESSVCQVTGLVLERSGCEVTVARNGAEAVDIYRERRDEIDLVFLDMVMPVMGGRETFLALQEIDPDVVVLVTSGYSVAGEAQELLDRGARRFIQKPYRNADLIQAIREIVPQSET